MSIRNYNVIAKEIEKNLSLKEIRSIQKELACLPNREQSKKLFEVLISQYLLEKYPAENHVICSLGGSPSVFIPVLQFLKPDFWENFRHIAFSGSWFAVKNIYGNTTQLELRGWLTKQPSKEKITAYRKYLESIGITPKTLVSGEKIYVILECIGRGSGLFSFATIIFDWVKEEYPSINTKDINIKFFCFPQIPEIWERFSAQSSHYFNLHSEDHKTLVAGDLFPVEKREGVYNQVLDESHGLGGPPSKRLVPSFKSSVWGDFDPHDFVISPEIQKFIYTLYIMITFPKNNEDGNNIYLEKIKQEKVKTIPLKSLVLQGEFNQAFAEFKCRYLGISKL